MIVACPLCQTRFLVAAGSFSGGSRKARCGSCRHVWSPSPEPEVTENKKESPFAGTAGGHLDGGAEGAGGGAPADTPPLASPFPAMAIPQAAVTTSRPWSKYAAIAAVALLAFAAALWGVADRRNIALRWPAMTRIYDRLGLDSHQPGDGIDFRDVKSELVYDGGILRLTVEGVLVNTTGKEQKLPHILAAAIGPDGSAIQSWRIDAPAATLAPLATVTFRSAINAPRDGVVNVNLNFVGRKNAAD